MSDLGMPAVRAEQEATSGAESPAQTAGQMLRAAREASGLHIAALAVSMKVPVKKLEALEADRLDLLPDAVFVRALAASVCRALKIDSAHILKRLPQNVAPRLDSESRSIDARFHSPGGPTGWTLPSLLRSPTLLVVGLLLVGVLLLVFFPDSSRNPDKVAEVSMVSAVPDPGPVVPAEVPAVSASVPLQASSEAAHAPVSVQAKVDNGVRVIDVASRATAEISFRQRGPSWVEVSDAKGIVLVRRTLVAGEALAVTGELPLAVVIGRADATDVEVRGKPFSLVEVAKDNVARFEVK